jgi:hypothetical protein
MALDLVTVMDQIGTALAAISGLRVAEHPADLVNPPQAIVGMPPEVEYDLSGARGADRAVLPVLVVVGKVSDRAAALQLAQYVSGTGARSVKTAIEAATVGQTVRVTMARTDRAITVAAVEYLAAEFDVEVIA